MRIGHLGHGAKRGASMASQWCIAGQAKSAFWLTQGALPHLYWVPRKCHRMASHSGITMCLPIMTHSGRYNLLFCFFSNSIPYPAWCFCRCCHRFSAVRAWPTCCPWICHHGGSPLLGHGRSDINDAEFIQIPCVARPIPRLPTAAQCWQFSNQNWSGCAIDLCRLLLCRGTNAAPWIV